MDLFLQILVDPLQRRVAALYPAHNTMNDTAELYIQCLQYELSKNEAERIGELSSTPLGFMAPVTSLGGFFSFDLVNVLGLFLHIQGAETGSLQDRFLFSLSLGLPQHLELIVHRSQRLYPNDFGDSDFYIAASCDTI